MSTVMAPNRPMLALWAGETCEDGVVDLAARSCPTARPRYSAVHVLIALVVMVRHHAC